MGCDSSIFIFLIYIWMSYQTGPNSDYVRLLCFGRDPLYSFKQWLSIRRLALTLTRFKVHSYVSVLTGSEGWDSSFRRSFWLSVWRRVLGWSNIHLITERKGNSEHKNLWFSLHCNKVIRLSSHRYEHIWTQSLMMGRCWWNGRPSVAWSASSSNSNQLFFSFREKRVDQNISKEMIRQNEPMCPAAYTSACTSLRKTQVDSIQREALVNLL